MSNLFWDDIDADIHANPEHARKIALELARIRAIDEVVNRLNSARESQHVSKAELARRVGVKDAAMRRLFTAKHPNPQLDTLAATAAALGFKVVLAPIDDSDLEPVQGLAIEVTSAVHPVDLGLLPKYSAPSSRIWA